MNLTWISRISGQLGIYFKLTMTTTKKSYNFWLFIFKINLIFNSIKWYLNTHLVHTSTSIKTKQQQKKNEDYRLKTFNNNNNTKKLIINYYW